MTVPTRRATVPDPGRATPASSRPFLGREAAARFDRPDLVAEPRRGLELLVLDGRLHVLVKLLHLAPDRHACGVPHRGLAHVLGAAVDAPEQGPKLRPKRGVALRASQPARLLERGIDHVAAR